MSEAEPLLPGTHCWRIEPASQASVVIDADAYFRAARHAMLKAKRQILLIGWDFDARILMSQDPEDCPEAPRDVGAFLTWLVKCNPDLQVYILRWDLGALKTLARGKTLWTLIKWRFAKRVHLKLDGMHPPGASHHQKIVVIDDCLAFCGGIDMTGERWDTRAHRDDEPGRVTTHGSPYKPWHDATTALQGKAAAALGELCRARWEHAGGTPIPPPQVENDCWPAELKADFTDVPVAISRSQPAIKDQAAILEIEALYLHLIARAKRWIYAESQYFASRKIAEAIARRLDEPDGPEIVIVNPLTAEGWLEPIAMDTARARLVEALRQRDVHDRFRMYHPHTAGGEPIYVHAKILTVDDDVIRVGSSNFNNRSLRLDTECDVTIDAADPSPAIAAIRDGLLAEHLDVECEVVAARLAETGSLIATIEGLRGRPRSLDPYEVPDLNGVAKWLAENEVLDPETPDDPLEAMGKGGLLRRLRR